MIKIYHNPRCSKSRETLQILEEKNEMFEVIKYLENPVSAEELQEIIKKLQLSPIDLVRTKEKEWKENFQGKELSDKDIIDAMVKFPRLIERPIVIKGNKAVIGRPPQKILEIL